MNKRDIVRGRVEQVRREAERRKRERSKTTVTPSSESKPDPEKVTPSSVPAPFRPDESGVAAYKTHKAEVMGPQQFIVHASGIDRDFGQQVRSESRDWHPDTKIHPVYQPDGGVKYDVRIPYPGAQYYHTYSAMLDKHPELIGMRAVTSPYLNIDLAMASPEKRRDIMVEWIHGIRGGPEGGLDWGRGVKTVVGSPFVQIASMKAAAVGIGAAATAAGGVLAGKGVTISPVIGKVVGAGMKAGYVGIASYDVGRTYQEKGLGAAIGRGVISTAMYESLSSGAKIGSGYAMTHKGRTGLTLYERGYARGVAKTQGISIDKARGMVKDLGVRHDVDLATKYYVEPSGDTARVHAWGVDSKGMKVKTVADVVTKDDTSLYYGKSLADKAGKQSTRMIFGRNEAVKVKSDLISTAKSSSIGFGDQQFTYTKGVTTMGVGDLARPGEATTSYGYFKSKIFPRLGLKGVKPHIKYEPIEGIRWDTGTVHPVISGGAYKTVGPVGPTIYGKYTEVGQAFIKTGGVPGGYVEMTSTSNLSVMMGKMNQQMTNLVMNVQATQPLMFARPAVTATGSLVRFAGASYQPVSRSVTRQSVLSIPYVSTVADHQILRGVKFSGVTSVSDVDVGLVHRVDSRVIPKTVTSQHVDVLDITTPDVSRIVRTQPAQHQMSRSVYMKSLMSASMVSSFPSVRGFKPFLPYFPRRFGVERAGLGGRGRRLRSRYMFRMFDIPDLNKLLRKVKL